MSRGVGERLLPCLDRRRLVVCAAVYGRTLLLFTEAQRCQFSQHLAAVFGCTYGGNVLAFIDVLCCRLWRQCTAVFGGGADIKGGTCAAPQAKHHARPGRAGPAEVIRDRWIAIGLRACYAMSGAAYARAKPCLVPAYARAMPCPVPA
eukprot:2705506-Rhodomonas_salina.3